MYKDKKGLSILVFFIVAIVYTFAAQQRLSPDGPEVWPDLNSTYNNTTEELTITVENGTYRQEHGQIKLVSRHNSTLTISNYESRANSNIWAEPTLLGLRDEGLTNLPIKPGDSITIENDGTDTDNDTITGIENGERIMVSYPKYSTKTPVRIVVSDNKSYTLHGGTTLELRKRSLNGTLEQLE